MPVIDHLEGSSEWQLTRAKGNGASYVDRFYRVLWSSECGSWRRQGELNFVILNL